MSYKSFLISKLQYNWETMEEAHALREKLSKPDDKSVKWVDIRELIKFQVKTSLPTRVEFNNNPIDGEDDFADCNDAGKKRIKNLALLTLDQVIQCKRE